MKYIAWMDNIIYILLKNFERAIMVENFFLGQTEAQQNKEEKEEQHSKCPIRWQNSKNIILERKDIFITLNLKNIL